MWRIRIWDVFLVDDGTLDTVLEARMRIQPSIVYTSRFSSETRSADPAEDDAALEALAQEAAEFADDCRAEGVAP